MVGLFSSVKKFGLTTTCQIWTNAYIRIWTNDARPSEFVSIILSVWKIFNANTPYKDIRLNDDLCRPLTFNDDRFAFLTQIVFWLEAWQALAPEVGKLTKQTFTSFRHACIALQEITNYLTGCSGFDYLLTSFLQTDPLEHHFGLYRMMSGSNFHISYL